MRTVKSTLLSEYIAAIPADLQDLLVPADENERQDLAIAIMALRLREEERSYVRDLQERYGVAIRPNETVKRTMIRVRLEILKEAIAAGVQVDLREHPGSLPKDPLE